MTLGILVIDSPFKVHPDIITEPEVSELKRTHIKSKIGPPGIILGRPKYDPQS